MTDPEFDPADIQIVEATDADGVTTVTRTDGRGYSISMQVHRERAEGWRDTAQPVEPGPPLAPGYEPESKKA